jgi:hypothetical protein
VRVCESVRERQRGRETERETETQRGRETERERERERGIMIYFHTLGSNNLWVYRSVSNTPTRHLPSHITIQSGTVNHNY